MKAKNIRDIFPILSVDKDGLVITKNADFCYCFEVTYPEIFIQSEGSYQAAFDAVLQSVRNLGEGFIVHKQDYFFEDNYVANTNGDSEDFIINANEMNFHDRPFINHRAFIYVILPSGDPYKKYSTASSLFKNVLVPKKMLNKKTLVIFKEKLKSFVTAINGSRILTLTRLNREQIIGSKQTAGLLDFYFTFSFQDKNLYDISSMNGGFKVGNKHIHTFAINDLDQYPPDLPHVVSYRDYSTDRTVMPASYGLSFGLNIPFNHVYNQVIYIPPQAELINTKISEVKKHFSFSEWSTDNRFSMEQKTAFIDTMKVGSLAIKAHFNIQVFHREEAVADAYKDAVSAAIQNAGFISKVVTTYAQQLFWSCIPSNAAELGQDNFATCMLDNGIAMFNLESNYQDSVFQHSGILVTDRFGSPRHVDLFFQPMKDKLINNRNFTVIGPSGSGKSFTMNNIVYYLLSSGSHVTIVDIGHSYRRMGEILNAKYIEHSDESPISLNPFYFEAENDLLSTDSKNELKEEFKQVIVQIIFLLFKKPGENITKAEEVTVFFMVSKYYEYLDNVNKSKTRQTRSYVRPCFDTFYDFIRDEFPTIFANAGGREGEEFDLKNFMYILTPFYRDGQYGYLLNGADDTDLSKHHFVIYELDNIKDHPILLPIITLMITNTYVTKLFGVRGKLKVLIIEEAWRAVSSDFFANFLLWAFKTARKHLGSIGVVTQEIEDLLKSQIIKDAIVQNTDIKIILDIRKYVQQADEVLKLFKINEANIPQIFSINRSSQQGRGAFKEMAIVLGDKCKVYGVEVSKYAYSLFTTEATEVDQIKAIAAKRNITQKEAAIEFAREVL